MNDLTEQLNALPAKEYLDVVGNTAAARFKAAKNTTSRASYFYEISTLCRRYSRLLKG